MMKICVDWVEGENNAVPQERATMAELKILVGRRNATAYEENGERAESLFVSVYGLAEGLAHEWWRMLGSRDDGISFRDYRDGYILPDVRVMFDGRRFRVRAEKFECKNPPLSFAACPEVACERAKFEHTLSEFIETVQARLHAKNLQSTPLDLCWARVKNSRQNPEEAAFCEAAGALHLDPYSISDAAASRILESARGRGGEVLLKSLNAERVGRHDQAESIGVAMS